MSATTTERPTLTDTQRARLLPKARRIAPTLGVHARRGLLNLWRGWYSPHAYFDRGVSRKKWITDAAEQGLLGLGEAEGAWPVHSKRMRFLPLGVVVVELLLQEDPTRP